jgi:hypothetical protein
MVKDMFRCLFVFNGLRDGCSFCLILEELLTIIVKLAFHNLSEQYDINSDISMALPRRAFLTTSISIISSLFLLPSNFP